MIQNLDFSILNYISAHLHNPFLDKLMPLVTSLGNMGLFWIALSIPMLISKKHRHVGFLILSAILVSTILGEGILKNIVQRPRPFLSVPDMQLLIERPSSYSFPSGHTACGFAAATIISKYYKKYSVFFFALACLIAFSRLYLYVHFPSDILGGMVLGTLSAIIVLLLYKNKFKIIKN